MAKNALANYGYPSAKELRNQAGVIADASVPTVAATTKPYNQQHQSVAGFLAAVLDALGSSKGEVADTYNDAQGQQSAIDSAAAARLASLGLGSYAPGVIATQGARGDSAAANLISQGASARNFIAKQPGIATGFAQTQNSAINKALSEALTQRMSARSQAYASALQQVQQNALQRADFLAGRLDARNSLAMQQAGLALQQQQFGEGVREFNLNRADALRESKAAANQARQQMMAQYGYDPVTGKTSKPSGGSGSSLGGGSTPGPNSLGSYTPTQIRALQKSMGGEADKAIQHGVPVDQFIHEIHTGPDHVPLPLAKWIALHSYGKLKGPNPKIHPAMYRSWKSWIEYIGRLQSAENIRENPSLNRPVG